MTVMATATCADYEVDLIVASEGYDRKTCWVHTRAGWMPPHNAAIMTLQKLWLAGDDVFSGLHQMRSTDGGVTWSPSPPEADANLGRRTAGNGVEEGVSDFTPAWHEGSGTLLGTGHTIRYYGDCLTPLPRPRRTAYSSYTPETGRWRPWKKLELPDLPLFYSEGAGSTQRLDLPSGEILLPSYFGLQDTVRDNYHIQCVSTVLRCRFDGETLHYETHGSELTLPEGRGFVEPSIVQFGGRFFLTLRNDYAGYVTAGEDGLHYGTPKSWAFDDGTLLGNYNTQQHWITGPHGLFLVYTRRGANNDHIMRHRAPLFMAQVDPERLCVLRDTERIIVPEKGARLCNFGITRISEKESWITVAEWMQTTLPDPTDYRICEQYGSNNRVYVAKIRFH